MTLDKVDRWSKLLGTALVKASFIDPDTGQTVEKNQGGKVQLDVMHGGVYDTNFSASPYHITELVIGFSRNFGGFSTGATGVSNRGNADMGNPASQDKSMLTGNSIPYRNLGNVNKVYWSPSGHKISDDKNNYYETSNPYGIIPAVPFFNQDPAHYYFLPINEPLIYANHALNMRITDLNHIAKFQSFGVPVMKGVERPKSVRQGRPVDDFNQLHGGSAQSRISGFSGVQGFGAGGQYRNFDHGLGLFRDGNADANALGQSLGPDTAITVGEKGDFKFAHPNADINGLIKSIQDLSDMVRMNHGLRPKYQDKIPPSGFATWMEKQGVMDENSGRRGKLFREREQQLFQVIKRLWNVHHSGAGDQQFSEDARLEVTYVPPEFPLDPKTKMEKLAMEDKLLETGKRSTYQAIYPHLTDKEIEDKIKQRRKDRMEQELEEAKVEVEKAKIFRKEGIMSSQESDSFTSGKTKTSSTDNYSYKAEDPNEPETPGNKIDNRVKHSQDSSGAAKGADEQEPKQKK